MTIALTTWAKSKPAILAKSLGKRPDSHPRLQDVECVGRQLRGDHAVKLRRLPHCVARCIVIGASRGVLRLWLRRMGAGS